MRRITRSPSSRSSVARRYETCSGASSRKQKWSVWTADPAALSKIGADMGTRTIAVLVTVAFSVIGVVGDYFLKLASAHEQPLRSWSFYLGFALYASTAFGWVFVMKHLKLATISVLYSVSLVLLLTVIGVLVFRESLNYFEVIGIALAVISLVLLMRFA